MEKDIEKDFEEKDLKEKDLEKEIKEDIKIKEEIKEEIEKDADKNTEKDMEAARIAASAQGDAQAFEALMAAYDKRIYALCLRRMGNAHDAEDAAQEAALRVWQRIGQYRGEASFATWLYRVTESVCIDMLRKRGRQAQPSLEAMQEAGFDAPDDAPTPEEAAQNHETREAVEQAAKRVPEGMRRVFFMRDVQGMSVEETARVLGVSAGTVKSRLFRARAQIAAALRAAAVAGWAAALLGMGVQLGRQSISDASPASMARSAQESGSVELVAHALVEMMPWALGVGVLALAGLIALRRRAQKDA